MDIGFIRSRITDLRLKMGVSEYQMSLDLGHSKNYIRGITSGRTLPSITEFLSICEYLNVTPKDFFDNTVEDPALIQALVDRARMLGTDDLTAVVTIVDRLTDKK